jgi:predicted ester cyclase
MLFDSKMLETLKSAVLATLTDPAPLASGGLTGWADRWLAPDVTTNLCAPFHQRGGRDALIEGLWLPLLDSFPDLARCPLMLLAGRFQERAWIAHCGHLTGLFLRDWLGIPATGRLTQLRYGCFDAIENGRIVQTYMMIDIPALMMDAGVWPLSPPLGAFMPLPAPATQDGLRPGVDAEGGQQSLDLVERMIAGLMRFDGTSFASMDMPATWHPTFHWYGPAPIGALRGLADYQRGHAGPFLGAFPDRVGGDHKCRIGDGAYVASTGWPSVRATHSGGGWLGLPPTGKQVGMRVMDFWRREGDKLAENWVFIDIPDLLQQMGVDVFARLHALRGGRPG